MKLIKPKLISGEIMTLIDEAEEKLIIISPYYNFSKWQKLLNTFNALKDREVIVEFYVRKNKPECFNEIISINYTPFEIPDLHTKLYLNEKYAIVSSMNLTESSDKKSLDIAYQTETEAELAELYKYYKTYIQPYSIPKHKNKIQEKIKKVELNKSAAEIYVSGKELCFSDLVINEPNIDFSNWKEIITATIKNKLNYKYADYYIRKQSLYFKTGITNLECYFYTNYGKSFFMIKISCAHNLYDEFKLKSLNIINETGAQINLAYPVNDSFEIFISYDPELISKDFDFIHNEDLPVIMKTISTSLYALKQIDGLIKIRIAQNGKQKIRV